MNRVVTSEQLISILENVQEAMVPTMAKAMRRAVPLVKGQAKKNCTPGHSPYAKAPYTDDDDPRREPPHMRDVMFGKVIVEGNVVRGIVGNTKRYSPWVHDGTSKMAPRPFILDAIKEHEQDIIDIFNEEIETTILQNVEGNLWGSTPSEFSGEEEEVE